ncbi:hypothetical protein ACLOJK_005947 [Asimina triloba]
MIVLLLLSVGMGCCRFWLDESLLAGYIAGSGIAGWGCCHEWDPVDDKEGEEPSTPLLWLDSRDMQDFGMGSLLVGGFVVAIAKICRGCCRIRKGRETRRSLLLEKMGGDVMVVGSQRRSSCRRRRYY